MAVGIALSSDVLASAVSAYTYGKNKNLDVKNGLIMMLTVMLFTVVGSWLSSLVPSQAMGSFSVFMTFLLGVKFIVRPVMTTKEDMSKASPAKRAVPKRAVRYPHRPDLRICWSRRRNDDAANFDKRPGLRAEDCRRAPVYSS